MLGLGNSITTSNFSPEQLLLDNFGGAGVGLSLRKISNSYNGPALQIRRSSDNVEVDVRFDSNGVVSLDSPVTNVTEETTDSDENLSTSATNLGQFVANSSYTDADSLGSADSALVQCWYDQSGNSNNATQVTAGKQPRIINGGAIDVEDGKPALFKQNQTAHLIFDSALVNGANFLYAVVYSDFSEFALLLSDTSRGTFFGPRSANNFRHDYDSSTANEFENFSATNLLTDHVLVISQRVGTTAGSVFVNNALPSNGAFTLGSSTDVNTTAGHIFDSNKDMTSKVQEIIFYPLNRSGSRTDIQDEINAFYSIF